MDEQAESEHWKQKYLDSLDELEVKEQQWSTVEQVLRQGLARLTLAADSHDHELNILLEKLRRGLRSGIDGDELRTLLERMAGPIRRLDESRKVGDPPPAANELLESILGRIDFPHGMGHRAKALQKQLLQADEVPEGKLIEAFIILIEDALHWQQQGDDGQEAGKRGLLSKLLPGRAREADSEDTLHSGRQVLSSMLDRLHDHPDVDQQALQERIDGSRQQAELLRLGRELAGLLHLGPPQPVVDGEELSSVELMLQLLERLEVPGELEDEVNAIREILARPDVAEHMERVIGAIAELVREMRHRLMDEKSEIESFLSLITERLREIDEGIQLSVSNQREAFEGGRLLDRQVGEQMDGITQTVSLAQDLDSLKQTIATRVDTIRSHMTQFRQDQGQRLEQAEQQVQQLNERMRNMQQESEQLRQRVKRQRDLAMVDPLTGVPNRLAYNERMELEYARWKRYGHGLVMAVWDVDRFKSVNDTYGHQAGDKVLTVIAKLLQRQIRETDFVARFGGEEFVLIMPETDLDGAAKVTEHLRKSVAACEFHFRGKRVPITISCGYSEFKGHDSAEQVFSRADAALYKAKEGGRNQCRIG